LLAPFFHCRDETNVRTTSRLRAHAPGRSSRCACLRAFRANQGLLLAGAVAYYTLLSIVPLLILHADLRCRT
jgi:uncharacterized BrkB/YihY/UPF0761 family membrane protein